MVNQSTKLAGHIDKGNFSISKIPLLSEESSFYDYSFLAYKYSELDLNNFQDLKKNWYKRAKELLPIFKNFKSLGEGLTPLIESKVYKNCFIKDEGCNPSGCFKDRESSIVLPFFIERGFKEFGIVSSGNAALSASLYGSIYGLGVKCFIPKNTSEAKKKLIKLFGGDYELSGDNYEECYHKFLELCEQNKKICNITPGVCSIRDQGDKLIAFEIFEEIGVPDYIIVPSANGGLLFGIFNGFRELKLLGLSDKMPVMIAVQIEGAAPLAEAFKQKKDFVILDQDIDTKAEGLVAMESYCSPKAQLALSETDGFVVLVKNEMLKDAMKFALSEEGILPEWTSSAGFAALTNGYEDGVIKENRKVVLINTGSGMKEIDDISGALA
ncbi:MAG: pyridoxal-phosphate dependent enzyme [Patescibacteria group bacterium]